MVERDRRANQQTARLEIKGDVVEIEFSDGKACRGEQQVLVGKRFICAQEIELTDQKVTNFISGTITTDEGVDVNLGCGIQLMVTKIGEGVRGLKCCDIPMSLFKSNALSIIMGTEDTTPN